MGHDVHFLERLSRVESAQADRALALYRDPALVRELLHDQKVPEGAERVAIALDEGEEPPHLIVARDGHFVTCLGAGMKVGPHPVLSRKKLESALVRVTRVRDANAALAQLEAKSSRSLPLLYRRLVANANRFSREDFQSLQAIQPLIGPGFMMRALEVGNDYVEEHALASNTDEPPERRVESLRRLWELSWGWTHFLVLAGTGDCLATVEVELLAETLAFLVEIPAQFGSLLGMWVRMVWAVGRLGRDAVATLKEKHRTSEKPAVRMLVANGLAALAMGHSRLRGEIRKHLERSHIPEEGLEIEMPIELQHRAEANVGKMLMRLVDGTEASAAETEQACRKLAEELFGDPELASAHLATHTAPSLGDQKGFTAALLSTPFVARAKPEELFLPAAQAEKLEPFSPELAMTLLRNSVYTRTVEDLPREPVRADPKVGRNEPCPCGSGKKSKRCCAA